MNWAVALRSGSNHYLSMLLGHKGKRRGSLNAMYRGRILAVEGQSNLHPLFKRKDQTELTGSIFKRSRLFRNDID